MIVSFLLNLLVICLIFGIVFRALDRIALATPFKEIVIAIAAVVLILLLLGMLPTASLWHWGAATR